MENIALAIISLMLITTGWLASPERQYMLWLVPLIFTGSSIILFSIIGKK